MWQCEQSEAPQYLKACNQAGKKGHQTWCLETTVAEHEVAAHDPLGCLEKKGLTPVSLADIQSMFNSIGQADYYRQAIGVA